MIVKIWPIKGAQGLKKSVLYVQDDNKVTKLDFDEDGKVTGRMLIDIFDEQEKNVDEYYINNEESIDRILAYVSNEEKIKKKYISGYLCEPERAQKDFENTWRSVKGTHPHKAPNNQEKEILAYHIVQSFPEDLDITDEEVHQCGLELLQRLEKHQGIVCSHVHPVVDEEGEVHGACKHNHILINAYVDPFRRDPNAPDRIKYHDCKESYAQLRVWNDEIAIEHGLPIILNPDKERSYSWKENSETKSGQSWKERVRLDIEEARRATSSWSQFKNEMESYGYSIREGAHVTYTTPNGQNKVRAHKLGQSYTKEGLELYWNLRERLEQDVAQAMRENATPPLWKLSKQYQGALTVDIPLGNPEDKDCPVYPLSLSKSKGNRSVLSTYFNSRDLYPIRDNAGEIITSATGQEIIDYLDGLNQNKEILWEEQRQEAEENLQRQEDEKRRKKEEEDIRRDYIQTQFRNSRTNRYYVVSSRDKYGRKRSNLELLFLIAAIVIQSEDGLWNSIQIPEGRENEAVFGPTAWKIQNMLDSIHVSREEGLDSPSDVVKRLNEVGAAYSRAKAAVSRTQRAKEKMEPLAKALEKYEKTAEIVDSIQRLPDGPGKDALREQYADSIDQYKQAKSVMYGYKVKTQEEIKDFKARFADISKNLPEMQEELDRTKEEYRKLKKLKYNMDLAQNEQYCYGPEYGAKIQQTKEELWASVTKQDARDSENRK